MAFEVVKAAELPNYLQVLIWGSPGVGKTELACTAPGSKLIINFDPNGPATVSRRDDVSVLDLSGAGTKIVQEFKKADPFELSKIGAEFDTWIVDSLSSVQELTTRAGIDFANSISKTGNAANIENPGMQAYGARNNLLLEFVRNVLRASVAQEKHIIFIGHEGPKEKDKDGAVNNVPLLLGGGLPTHISVKLSEIWTMYDLNRVKTIAIRPARMREVAKTRMFLTTGTPEFPWSYSPDKSDEEQPNATIAGWHESWIKNGKRKISLPK